MTKTQTQAVTSLLDWAGEKKGRSWEIRSLSAREMQIELSDGAKHIRRVVTEQCFRDAALDALDFAVEECIGLIARLSAPPDEVEITTHRDTRRTFKDLGTGKERDGGPLPTMDGE